LVSVSPSRHWPADRLRLLSELRSRRLSATEIAVELGVSRNAVLGKLHRLKLRSFGQRGRKPRSFAILEPEADSA